MSPLTTDSQAPNTIRVSHLNHADRPVRVLYVMGAGRSGSTLLDSILANHPDAVGGGELVNLHSAGWSSNEVCACGKLGTECDFWTRVRSAWQRRIPDATVASYIALQKHFEFPHWFGLIQFARLARQRFFPSGAFQTYLRQTAALYQAIVEVSGRSIVVDSSKTPIRAAVLSRIQGLDLRLIHLVRDARAVAWSRRKSLATDQAAGVQTTIKPRPSWYSAGYWALINLLSMLVCLLSGSRSLRLRYEDFVTEPKRELERLGTLCDLDFTATITALLHGDPIRVEHPIAGNRMRMGGSVRLKPDWEWRDRLPTREQVICWLCAGWMLWLFGYSRNRRTAAEDVAMQPANATRPI
ncbi:MAG: sulfotransferase [Planctomycetia bacterium]|nr:sulfotransferase [Planctomycetia bacterium]